MLEIWKDIPVYEGFYQASNLGRVKSLDRVTRVKGGKATMTEAFSIRFKLAQRLFPDVKFITT